MCSKCQREVASDDTCIRCSKSLGKRFSKPEMVNPNFDVERFDALSKDNDDGTEDDDTDYNLINQILNSQSVEE